MTPRPAKNYTWSIRQADAAEARRLQEALRIHPAVARVLAARGFCADSSQRVETFLKPTLKQLHDPMTLRDMDVAAARLAEAVHRGEPICIYGDYDTDGITGTAVLLKTLQHVGAQVTFHIPNRMDDGYGLNVGALQRIAAEGAKLVVTVDTGITAVEPAIWARGAGLDLIITDHHRPGDTLPDACAVVNPNRDDCDYPNKALTGVGVAFKLCHALLKTLGRDSTDSVAFLRSLLDLVAIGTVADVGSLMGENRVLVKHGLESIRTTNHMGLRVLLQQIGLAGHRISAQSVGFKVAPRLNAAGRTDDACMCVELMTTNDERRAREIVAQLETLNTGRRNMEQRIIDACMLQVQEHFDPTRDRVLVCHGEDWHVGVVGIVASRLMDMFHRSAIVLTNHGGVAKGSARSLGCLDMFTALTACREMLLEFGGHPAAAGLQIEPERVAEFRAAINAHARTVVAEEDLQPTLNIDAELSLDELDHDLPHHVERLEPFGHSNPQPLMSVQGLRLQGVPSIVGQNHLRLTLRTDKNVFSAIGFNMGARYKEVAAAPSMDVAFHPTISTFRGDGLMELNLRDVRVSNAR